MTVGDFREEENFCNRRASELLLGGGRFCDNRYRTRDDNLLITAARLRTFADWKNALSSEDSQNVMPVVI